MPFTVEQARPLYIRLHADAPTSKFSAEADSPARRHGCRPSLCAPKFPLTRARQTLGLTSEVEMFTQTRQSNQTMAGQRGVAWWLRSEERRVGKEWRDGWWAGHDK